MSRSTRTKRHPQYYALKAYQMLMRLSDDYMAGRLGITKRTYTDKVNGYADFTPSEAIVLAQILNRTQDEIFLT